MAFNLQILFLALFAISTLHSAAAHFSWMSFMNAAKDNQKVASDKAASIIQKNPDYVAAVVPIMKTKKGKSFIGEYYKCTMYMKDTRRNYMIYAPENLVTPRSSRHHSGPKQICPQSGDSPTNYHCEHAVLVVDEKKWDKAAVGRIFYSLEFVNEVNLIGHDKYENHFDHLFLVGMSLIRGGRSSNYYDIKFADASTLIYLNSASKSEVINLSNAKSCWNVSLKFYAENDMIHGELAFDSSLPARLEWTDDFKKEIENRTRKWEIVGRENMPEKIECSNREMMNLLRDKITIIANGLGGNENNSDIITNCMDAILKPFTIYNFTYPDEEYRLAAFLKNTSSATKSFRSHSTIHLHENDLRIDFDYPNYMERIVSMKYSPWNNNLTLEIIWPGESVIFLEVKGILRSDNSDGLPHFEYSALSMAEQGSEDFLSPVIEQVVEFSEDTVLNVAEVRLYRQIVGTGLNDTIAVYREVLAQTDYKWKIEMMIELKTREVFYFGSPDVNIFYIMGQVMFIQPQNGADSIELTQEVQEYIWIDNEANDGLFDTLEIATGVCNDLKVEKNVADHRFMPRSEFDLVLRCEKNLSKPSVKVVLMNYLKDKSYRHFEILWDNVEYIILPEIIVSSGTYSMNNSDTYVLGRVIDFKSATAVHHLISKPTSLWILLDDENTCEIEAYEGNSNVVISVKSMNLSIELKNFFKDGQVSEEWSDTFFAVADDLSDDATKIEFLKITSTGENELISE